MAVTGEIIMALACGICGHYGTTFNAVLMVVIDYVSKVLSNHMWYITDQLKVYLNRYGSYGEM